MHGTVQMPRPVKRTTKKTAKARLAHDLCSLYQDLLFTKRAFRPNAPGIIPYKKLSAHDRRHFMRAAEAVIGAEATARSWIAAQFAGFERYNRTRSRPIVPQPGQLYGMGAHARYAEYLQGQQEEEDRRPTEEDRQVPKFFRETRKVRGMSRFLSRSEEDVLTQYPEEFSREFLEHRGVWDEVAETYDDRLG